MGNETICLFPNLPRNALIKLSVDLSEDRFSVAALTHNSRIAEQVHSVPLATTLYRFPFAVVFFVTGIGTIVHRVIRKRKEKPEKRALAKDIELGEQHNHVRPH